MRKWRKTGVGGEVRAAVKKLKEGKAAEGDGLPGEVRWGEVEEVCVGDLQ